MGVEVPSWVAEMFQVLTGDGWPAVDEDEVEDLARLWLGVREALAGLAPEVTRSARLLADSGGVEGRAREALVAAVGLVTGDGDLTLEKLAAGFGELGDYLHRVALQTQYLKIAVVEELVVLAAEIAYLVAMIPWTFGASAAGVAGLQVFGRAFAVAVVRQLAVAVAVGEVLQVGLDAVAQLAQFVEGWRGEWDGDLTRSAAVTGLVGGVLGPVAVGLGHYPGRVLGRALGGVAGRNAGKEAGDWATTVVKGGAHEYAADGVSGAVQGQGWRPDTFSTTAGAVDEGTTAAAGLGRRKRGLAARAGAAAVPELLGGPGRYGSLSPVEVADALMERGGHRLDGKDRWEGTVSRVQDRPRLLLLTEGLVGVVGQGECCWVEQFRDCAQQVARELVSELASGQSTRARLLSLVDDPRGPFGADTWQSFATRVEDLAGRVPAVREAGLAGIENEFAAVSRAFHAAVAGEVPGYGWFRRPVTGASPDHPSSSGSSDHQQHGGGGSGEGIHDGEPSGRHADWLQRPAVPRSRFRSRFRSRSPSGGRVPVRAGPGTDQGVEETAGQPVDGSSTTLDGLVEAVREAEGWSQPQFDGWTVISDLGAAEGQLLLDGCPIDVNDVVGALARDSQRTGHRPVALVATGALEVARALVDATSRPVIATAGEIVSGPGNVVKAANRCTVGHLTPGGWILLLSGHRAEIPLGADLGSAVTSPNVVAAVMADRLAAGAGQVPAEVPAAPAGTRDSQVIIAQDASGFVVVANRLPVTCRRGPDGSFSWKPSPGGLVTALEPILRREKGTWVGWTGIANGTPGEFDSDGAHLVPVGMDASEVREFYDGMSNGTFWPLYHDAVVPPGFHRSWWEAYEVVNRRFAHVTAARVLPGGVVWVQDYQLQLVPQMVRELRPDLRIGFFDHIPFPPYEIFSQLPWRRQVITGLLGADLLGFQRSADSRNFLRACQELGFPTTAAGVHVDVPTRSGIHGAVIGRRTVRAAAFPISIDTKAFDELARRPDRQARARQIRADLGNPELVLLGVDRLDYTKGILHRLRAFGELLDEGRLTVPGTVMVQVATPSRETVEQYQDVRRQVEMMVGRINGRHDDFRCSPVRYLYRSLDREELVALYLAADVMLVTPLRDGMNLVAKEYVACRVKGCGALILSEFTGAAHEFRQAYLINPHDLNGLKATIVAAASAGRLDSFRRMSALRKTVSEFDVERWATNFLHDLTCGALAQPQAVARPA